MGLKLQLSLSACASTIKDFDKWASSALIAISPCADVILFSGQTLGKTFIAKLSTTDPTNQCCMKTLEIPLDYDEQITCLLCVPVMSTKRTSFGSVDWTAFVVGLSSGYVKFYTEQSICLLSLKFIDEPVINIKLQTQKNNANARSQTHFASIIDELLIVYKTCAIVCDGIGLYENLRISREDTTKNQPNYEPAYTTTNLPTILTCQKWRFDNQSDHKVLDADLFGMRCSTKFDIMRSDSMNSEHIPSKSFTRTLVMVGSNPFLSCHKEARETISHSYTEMIGSLLPFWSKPQPSKIQIDDVNSSSLTSLFDKNRVATRIIPSPDKRLATITDDFGRVMLVDVTNWLVVRVWKGYRNAQCGWVEVKRSNEENNPPYASFLVIYAPKRGLLEVWSAQRGPRVAAFNVGKHCRLLYAGYKMLNMRAESLQKGKPLNLLVEQSYSTNCYLLDARNETVFSIELPYTYSLYKYGDLQSRDRLLITELVGFMQHEAEIDVISDTLDRISLADSQEQAIQKIALLLTPDRIIQVMKIFIANVMKNYDNQTGDSMADDDQSIMELCKRLIRMCSIFLEQSELNNKKSISHQNVDLRLVDECEQHPKEIEELAEQLGWQPTEVLRYLSLLALERSYDKKRSQNPWPSMGEPLTWVEFIDCFDLRMLKIRSHVGKESLAFEGKSIKLRDSSYKFLSQETIQKTALFMYRKASEDFLNSALNSPEIVVEYVETGNYSNHNHLEPASRLAMLFQFWLSTSLCNHWKTWTFFQSQLGQISDELKVLAMAQNSDEALIDAWKRIYHLILESDNVYASILAAAAIRGDILRSISDNEKREKLGADTNKLDDNVEDENLKTSPLDWECLCVDAERISLLVQQLEDVLLLKMLLRYSLKDGHLVENFVYRVPRISVANILRGGPTVVSELIAQWAVQANVHPKIFTQSYGLVEDETDKVMVDSPVTKSRLLKFRTKVVSDSSEESAKELLHHTKTSFPRSLEANVLLLNCLWEFCNRWASTSSATDKHQYLNKALDCLSLLDSGPIISLKHNSAYLSYKTFFQRTFERLTTLLETNSTLLSPKCLRSREVISRRELNMGDDCLDDFVQFCHNLSDLMLETYPLIENSASLEEEELRLKEQLLSLDDWWSTLTAVNVLDKPFEAQTSGSFVPALRNISQLSNWGSVRQVIEPSSLMNAAITRSRLVDIETLVELNHLTTLILLIFRLKLIKAYPISLIGEKSVKVLKLHLQHSPSDRIDIKKRPGQLDDLRKKFARKCIVSLIEKLTEETSDLVDHDEPVISIDSNQRIPNQETSHKVSLSGKLVSGSESEADCSSQRDYHDDVNDWADHSSEAISDLNVESNESMVLFTHLLTLANEWQIDSDELYLELVFEMFRCNHDKLGAQLSNRVRNKQILSSGLLKISAQRVLILFGLSPTLSSQLQWRQRVDKWSLFQPNVASWLKSIQDEEIKRELAHLVFPESLRSLEVIGPTRQNQETDIEENVEKSEESFDLYIEQSLGLRMFVLGALESRTKSILETVTNYLDDKANRLAYDLLQLLESKSFATFLNQERERWLKERQLSND